jgi:hypothetical protein
VRVILSLLAASALALAGAYALRRRDRIAAALLLLVAAAGLMALVGVFAGWIGA